MLIGILATGPAPEDLREAHGDFPAMFRRLLDGQGFAFRDWAVHDGDFPEGPEAAEGWLITGSKHGVYEPHPWIPPLEDLIRRIMAARRPLAGICFGHQIMAQATGGRVEKSDRGWGLGAMEYDDLEAGGRLRVVASHQDQVVAAPPGTRVIAASEFCPLAGLAWEGAPAISWQFHPEFPAAFSAALIRNRRGTVYDAGVADAALASLAAPLDSGAVAERIAGFFRSHRRAAAA